MSVQTPNRLSAFEDVYFKSLETPIHKQYANRSFVDLHGHTFAATEISSLIVPSNNNDVPLFRCPYTQHVIPVNTLYPNLAVDNLVGEIQTQGIDKIVQGLVRKKIERTENTIAKRYAIYKEEGLFRSLICQETNHYFQAILLAQLL